MEKASITSGNTRSADFSRDVAVGVYTCPHPNPLPQGEGEPFGSVGKISDRIKSSKVELRNSAIHATGAFAKCDIKAGEWVVDYAGERIEKAESLRRCEMNNQYIFGLDERFDIDGSVPWNVARFINHSCVPNCEACPGAEAIQIVASRDIKAGEEITFNYGYDLEDYREYPCNCGVVGCVGYIVAEEFFEHLRKQRTFAAHKTGGAETD